MQQLPWHGCTIPQLPLDFYVIIFYWLNFMAPVIIVLVFKNPVELSQISNYRYHQDLQHYEK